MPPTEKKGNKRNCTNSHKSQMEKGKTGFVKCEELRIYETNRNYFRQSFWYYTGRSEAAWDLGRTDAVLH